MDEKSFFAKNKVRFAILIIVAVVGTILPLAILGKITITADQVFNFAEWLFGLFAGAHAAQRGTSYVAQAMNGSPQTPATTADAPEASD